MQRHSGNLCIICAPAGLVFRRQTFVEVADGVWNCSMVFERVDLFVVSFLVVFRVFVSSVRFSTNLFNEANSADLMAPA